MRYLAVLFLSTALVGCSSIQKYWPRDHDPVMFDRLVTLDLLIEKVNCEAPDWTAIEQYSESLAKYSEWRNDPQAENIKGLHLHAQRMTKGGSKTFCELGKNTALQRIETVRSVWKAR